MRDADRSTQLKTPKREEAQLKTKEKIEEINEGKRKRVDGYRLLAERGKASRCSIREAAWFGVIIACMPDWSGSAGLFDATAR
jgi:hypothetical protein